jgi:hypothetical protein
LLATCFGEVGAINANFLDEATISNGTHSQKAIVPPWYFSPYQFGIQLIATHLVTSLKAASSSSDQHKIAFSIQQLLSLLNDAGKAGLLSSFISSKSEKLATVDGKSSYHGDASKPKMDSSLVGVLIELNVFDDVEPFWFSEFHEVRNVSFLLFF